MTIYVSVPTIQGVMDIKNGSYITEYVEYYRSDESNTRNSLVASESIQITLNDGTTLILKGARKDLPYGRHTGYVTYAERSKVIIEFTQQDSQWSAITLSPHFLWGAEFFYIYDGDGNIVRSIDLTSKKEYDYEYEEGRIVRATEADIELSGEIVTSKVIVNTVKYYYNTEGKMTKKVITPASGSAQTI